LRDLRISAHQSGPATYAVKQSSQQHLKIAKQITNGFVGSVWRAQETLECATLSTMNINR
jgi:hypothetical protein